MRNSLFLFVILFGSSFSIAQADISFKAVKIDCRTKPGLIQINAEHDFHVGTPDIFLGYSTQEGMGGMVRRTCYSGRDKVEMVFNYFNNTEAGRCGSDPGANITITVNDKKRLEARFDETCDTEISSVNAVLVDFKKKEILTKSAKPGESVLVDAVLPLYEPKK